MTVKPVDFRNATWEQIREQLVDMRERVYDALARYGPCTTRCLAEKSGIDILSVRPRVTELYQLKLVELVQPEELDTPVGGEGIYRVVPLAVAQVRFEKQRQAALNPQMSFL